MNIEIIVSQSKKNISQSQQIRSEVFGKEQGIPLSLDLDGLDESSYHCLALYKNKAIGVARLSLLSQNNATLSRVAVKKDFRGNSIASKLIKRLIIQAETLDVKCIDIHPHEHLREYYESFGFRYIETAGEVSNHKLIKMSRI